MTGLQAVSFRLRVTLLAVAVLMVALPLSAGELYQWKDAKGVTHYSDTRPPSGAYENRRITGAGVGVATEGNAAAPAENSQCTTARANLALLESGKPVLMNNAGDGDEPVGMTAAQRSAQKQLAEAAINAYCTAPATE